MTTFDSGGPGRMEADIMKRKYRAGTRVMLAGAILYCLTQIFGYTPTEHPWNLPRYWDSLSQFIPAWTWMLAWGAVAAVCLYECIKGSGRTGISMLVGLIAARAVNFGASYIVSVVNEGWGSREWHTFGVSLFTAVIIIGLLMKVGALKPRRASE